MFDAGRVVVNGDEWKVIYRRDSDAGRRLSSSDRVVAARGPDDERLTIELWRSTGAQAYGWLAYTICENQRVACIDMRDLQGDYERSRR